MTGRQPRTGHREMMVGAALMHLVPAISIGKTMRLQGQDWLVTGTFSAGSFLDFEAVGPAAMVQTITGKQDFNIIVVQLKTQIFLCAI